MKLLLTLALVSSVFFAQAHAYYFGFAEMSYNTTESHYEATLVVSTHDVEEYFQSKGLAIKEVEDHIGDEKMLKEMAKVLLTGFAVKAGTTALNLTCIGYEILPNGLTNYYFYSQKTPNSDLLSVRFDMLMDFLPEQQNKLTYLLEQKSITSVFTQEKKTAEIKIN